jgi:membrane-associated HD superfamily phosphohydrolase
LLVEEAVSIGATYLRADTLPQPYRDRARQLLREYVDLRLALDDAQTIQFSQATAHSKQIQDELWLDTANVAQNDRSAITASYANSLIEMIDLHEKRVAALENRIAPPIWILIVSVSLIAVFTRGATLPSRFWLSLVLMPLTIAIVVALIADLDAPSHGLIRLDQRPLQRLKAEVGGGDAH